MPDLTYELRHGWGRGLRVCGADEVGRGPLAGPVVAAAVVLPPQGLPPTLASAINDSKKLSARQREDLFVPLTELCQWATAESSVEEITQLNILHAALLAVQRSVESLAPAVDVALIDGNHSPKLACETVTVIGGDGLSLSIAAASIIAKVTRDRLMQQLADECPGYGWEHNAGYGTKKHLEALERLGVTRWHRAEFAPVARCLARRKGVVSHA